MFSLIYQTTRRNLIQKLTLYLDFYGFFYNLTDRNSSAYLCLGPLLSALFYRRVKGWSKEAAEIFVHFREREAAIVGFLIS